MVARRHGTQLLLRFREGDVEPGLALMPPFEQELQGKRGLAGAGRAFDEIDAVRKETAAQHVVEPGDAGRGAGRSLLHGRSGVVHGSRRSDQVKG